MMNVDILITEEMERRIGVLENLEKRSKFLVGLTQDTYDSYKDKKNKKDLPERESVKNYL